MKFLPKIKKLDGRGLSHIILPLLVVVAVGAVGTYKIVGSHAASPNAQQASANKPVIDAHHGGLMLFTDGKYVEAAVSVQGGANPKAYHCGGSFGANNNRFLKLPSKTDSNPATWGKVFSCTPIGNTSFYHVIFEYKDADTGKLMVDPKLAPVNVDIDANTCTFVHPSGANYKAPPVNSVCSVKTTDAPPKLDGNLRVLPQLSSNHKEITGYSDLRIASPGIGRSIKYKCSGSVNITVSYNDGKKTTDQHYNRPLKYTKDSTKKYNNGEGYCAATLPHINTSHKTGTWTFNGTLSNNTYFNDATAQQATVTISTLKVQSNGGVQAN